MKRVLEVIRQGQIGGGESHLLDLIYFLDKKEFEPICLSFTDGEMINRLQAMGVKCHVIHTTRPFDLKVQKQIKALILAEHIDVVHAHGSRAASNVAWAARRLRVPLIYTVHGWSFHDDQSFVVKWLRSRSEKWLCRYSDAVICVSQSNADTGKNVFGLTECHVIENGINLERFNADAHYHDLRPEMGFGTDDFVVGFIARCTKQKNPIGFLNALEMAHSSNPRVKGLFVGEGDMDSEADAFIRSNRMDSYVFRSKFRTDIPELLSAIDVYCLPSLWEGLSIALLEAMAMGKPIVATPTDGTSEVIRDKVNGIIVPFGDTGALAHAMTRLSNFSDLCRKYGHAARTIVESRFNAQRVANKVAEIYENIKC